MSFLPYSLFQSTSQVTDICIWRCTYPFVHLMILSFSSVSELSSCANHLFNASLVYLFFCSLSIYSQIFFNNYIIITYFLLLRPFLSRKKKESPLPSFGLKICIILWFPAPADGILYILHISMITAFHLLRPQKCFQWDRANNQ